MPEIQTTSMDTLQDCHSVDGTGFILGNAPADHDKGDGNVEVVHCIPDVCMDNENRNLSQEEGSADDGTLNLRDGVLEEPEDRPSPIQSVPCSSVSEVELESMHIYLHGESNSVPDKMLKSASCKEGEMMGYNSEINYDSLVKSEVDDRAYGSASLHTLVSSDYVETITENPQDNLVEAKMPRKKRAADVCEVSCDICLKAFMSKASLARHMRAHRAKTEDGTVIYLEAGEPRFTCPHCGKGFSQWFRLKKHEYTHSTVKPFSCGVCGAGFNQKYSLQCHEKNHSDETPFECSVCKKAFNQKVKLKVHLRTHTGERPYKCSFCNKAFIQRPHLHAHERVHTNEKPYSCKFCPKAFSQLGNLQKHEMIHTGLKPFQCQFCFKSFVTSQHLVDHERTHTGEKPWVCNICGLAFAQNSTLNRHKQIVHTKQKPCIKSWFCGTCSIRFVDETTFKNHQEVHDASIRSYVPEKLQEFIVVKEECVDDSVVP